MNTVDSCYTIVREGTVGYADALFPPLSVLNSVVWKSALLNFQALMKTESYISLCHDTMMAKSNAAAAADDDNDDNDDDDDDDELQRMIPEYFERFGDQFGILLLQMILEQLVKVKLLIWPLRSMIY